MCYGMVKIEHLLPVKCGHLVSILGQEKFLSGPLSSIMGRFFPFPGRVVCTPSSAPFRRKSRFHSSGWISSSLGSLFPFRSTRGRQRCFCVECRVFIHHDEYHPFRAIFFCAFSPPRGSSGYASSATMIFRCELTRAFLANKLRVVTHSAAKEELSGSL